MTTVIVVVGIALLVGIAVLVGISMDTEAQRVHWREVARERRERNEERRTVHAERLRLHEERRLLDRDRRALRERAQARGLCSRCPLRDSPEWAGHGNH
ncbi:MAG: hypothetical protein ACRDQ0_04835 [Pseudonocardia sp.]